jgi:DNA-binding transcriptional MerR regulator
MSPSRDSSTSDEGFSLHDLAALTGIEARTIRSYVERGLIPPPDSLGRGARYPQTTLDRLRVMLLLRDANRSVSLDQLRVVLQSLSPSQIAAIANGDIKIGALIDTDARPFDADISASKTVGAPGDALSYLRTLRSVSSMTPTPGAVREEAARYPAIDPDLSALAQAAQALTALAGVSASVRSTRGEAWYRIAVTPDLELNVRGHYGDEELAHFHRIADALRNLLTKGPAR